MAELNAQECGNDPLTEYTALEVAQKLGLSHTRVLCMTRDAVRKIWRMQVTKIKPRGRSMAAELRKG